MAASEGLFIAIAQSDSFSIAVNRVAPPPGTFDFSQKLQTRLTRQRRRGPLSIQLPLADPHYGKLQEPHARIDTPRTNPAHKANDAPSPTSPPYLPSPNTTRGLAYNSHFSIRLSYLTFSLTCSYLTA